MLSSVTSFKRKKIFLVPVNFIRRHDFVWTFKGIFLSLGVCLSLMWMGVGITSTKWAVQATTVLNTLLKMSLMQTKEINHSGHNPWKHFSPLCLKGQKESIHFQHFVIKFARKKVKRKIAHGTTEIWIKPLNVCSCIACGTNNSLPLVRSVAA